MTKYELIRKSDKIFEYFVQTENTQNMTDEQKEKIMELFDIVHELNKITK